MSPFSTSQIMRWSSAILSWACANSPTKSSKGSGALLEWCCGGDARSRARQKFVFHPECFAYPAGMSLLPFEKLPAYKPRRFLSAQIDLGEWSHIEPLFDQLEGRAPQCGSAAELERWLVDWSELGAALD